MKPMINAAILPKEPYILTRQTYLGTLQDESPKAMELLAEFGLHCMSCYFSGEDTLEIGAQKHGMTDEDLNLMIEEINGELKKV